jgi:hypothetical protein
MPAPLRSSRAPYLLVFLGVIAGAIIATGISAVMARGSKRAVARYTEVDPKAEDEPRERSAADLERLALTLSAANARGTAEKSPAPTTPSAPPPSAAEQLRQHEADVEEHYRKPVDSRWAPAVTKAYSEDLAGAVQQLSAHFKLEQLDCRSDTCVATLQWPTRGAAMTEWNDLLTFPYRANCGRAIVLPEPAADGSDSASPVRAKLVFDCSETKDEPLAPPGRIDPLAVNRRPAAANESR